MAQRIFKYKLYITDEQLISIPAGAEILSVQAQGDELCLWAKVDEFNTHVQRRFYINGTGHQIDPQRNARYIGTAQMHPLSGYGGQVLVWHVFDGGEA